MMKPPCVASGRGTKQPYPLILRCKLLRDMVLAMLELIPAVVATSLARV